VIVVTLSRRDEFLLSYRSATVTGYRPDFDALKATQTRSFIGVGEESAGTFAARAGVALAERLGQEAIVFPSHHGGFTGGDTPYAGKPEEFACRLREVLPAKPVPAWE